MASASVWTMVADMLDPQSAWDPFPKQRMASDLAAVADEVLFGGAAGPGKALAVDTPLPTPTGWVPMADVQVGVRLLDSRGRVCRVYAVTPTYTGNCCYEVLFDDGQRLVADDEHRWVVQTIQDRRRGGSRVITTAEMCQGQRVNGRTNYSVRLAGAADGPDRDLPVEPYLLGLWLGDGNSDNGGIHVAYGDEAVLDGLEAREWRGKPGRGSRPFGIVGLKSRLRQAGVLGNKHLPDVYLRASLKQRLALLQGLMDSDGGVNPDGTVTFCSSRGLAPKVLDLVLGLGHKATMRTKRTRATDAEVVNWSPPEAVFRLARKAEAQSHRPRSGRADRRYVVSVRPVESVPVRCLSVDSPDHTYLAGSGRIPTHNTEWLMEHGCHQMRAYPNNRGLVLRRVYPSLNRTIIPRLKAKLRNEARWNANEHTFSFPNGSILECASLQYTDDVLDYQGAEYGWLGFEEVTEFQQSQYEFMLSRLRAPADGIRPHVCNTTNPGGPGHTWVKRRFVKPKPEDVVDGDPLPKPTEVWRPAPTEDKPKPLTRVFIPAVHTDNPKLMERDPTYMDRLREQSNRGLRRALETGDWDAIDAVEGALWTLAELDMGRLRPEWYTRNVKLNRRVVAVDPSDGEEQGDEYGVAVCSQGLDRIGYVEASYAWRDLTVKKLAERTIELYYETKAGAIVVERNHGGKWMVETFRAVDPVVNIREVWASDAKKTRAEPVAALFEYSMHREPHQLARMVGFQEELEEELTTTAFAPGEPSPNRLDALVWAMTDLMLGNKQARKHEAQVRDVRLVGRR